jgi:hypothetical protein
MSDTIACQDENSWDLLIEIHRIVVNVQYHRSTLAFSRRLWIVSAEFETESTRGA